MGRATLKKEVKPYDYFGNLGIGGDLHNGNISVLLSRTGVDV